MGGKVTGAIAAIAVSSASASIVGAVYTGFKSVGVDYHSVFGSVERADKAPVTAAVVVDTDKNQVTSLPDLKTESESSRCQDVGGRAGCVLVFPAPESKLSFFGYTVSLPRPMDWYGYDGGDDLYRAGEEQQFLRLFSDLKPTDEHAHQKSGDKGKGENAPTVLGTSNFDSGDNSPLRTPFPRTGAFGFGDSPFAQSQLPGSPNPNPTEAVTPAVPAYTVSPIVSGGGGASIPEPSTWAMMLAGFAGLGFAGLRRARAARQPERRRA